MLPSAVSNVGEFPFRRDHAERRPGEHTLPPARSGLKIARRLDGQPARAVHRERHDTEDAAQHRERIQHQRERSLEATIGIERHAAQDVADRHAVVRGPPGAGFGEEREGLDVRHGRGF